jgi:UPF0271 protein
VQRTIDLNCDLGEGAGHDAELMPLISSANIACGAHAGDLGTMIEAVELALKHRAGVGAHPGYFDLDNFGRAERDISPSEAGRLVLLQIEQLYEIAGDKLRHVKLHGAFYHQVCRDAALADGVIAELARLWPRLIIVALANSQLAQAAKTRGLRVAEEVFADRTFRRDGTLTPRSEPGAVLTDPETVVAQVLSIVRDGRVRTSDGGELAVRADTLCVHGDGPNAVTLTKRIVQELETAGVAIRMFRG